MSDPEKLSPPQFERFRDFIYRQSGIRMDTTKITLVSNRIRRRLRAGEFSDFDTYYKHLTSPKGAARMEVRSLRRYRRRRRMLPTQCCCRASR